MPKKIRSQKKAQVGTEALLGVGLVLFTLIIVLTITSNWNTQKDILEVSYSNESSCRILAFTIDQAYAAGDKTRIDFELEQNTTIDKDRRMVFFNGYPCNVSAKLKENETLLKGRIRIKNTDNEVDLENA